MDIFNTGNSTGMVRLTGSIAAAVCLVVTTSILLLLIFHKAYTSTLQRLLLYLMIFTVIQEACLLVGYATQFEYSGHEPFCNMINTVWQWSDTVGYVLTFCIIVFLSYKVCKQLKGNPVPRLSSFRVPLECLFIFIVLVLPLTYILPLLPLAKCSFFYITTIVQNDNFGTHWKRSLYLWGNWFKWYSRSSAKYCPIRWFCWNVCDHNSTICCILLLGLQVQGNKSNTLPNTHLAGILCCSNHYSNSS